MKNIFLVVFMFFGGISVAQQAQKTLLKTFNVNGHQQVVLDFDGSAVEVEKWNQPTVRVQIQITYTNANVHIMKYLITKGRYDLKSASTADGFEISSPNTNKEVKINKEGTVLVETVTYKVFVPENMSVIVSDESQASVINPSKNNEQ